MGEQGERQGGGRDGDDHNDNNGEGLDDNESRMRTMPRGGSQTRKDTVVTEQSRGVKNQATEQDGAHHHLATKLTTCNDDLVAT